MRWCRRLFVGDGAKSRRKKIISRAEKGKALNGVYLLTLPGNPRNLLDIYPEWVLMQDYFCRSEEIQVVGIAQGHEEAVMLAAEILEEVCRETGAYDTHAFFQES